MYATLNAYRSYLRACSEPDSLHTPQSILVLHGLVEYVQSGSNYNFTARPIRKLCRISFLELPGNIRAEYSRLSHCQTRPNRRTAQDEALGLLTDDALGTAAQEILAGKLFTHSTTLNPRLVVVDKAGCCGGAYPVRTSWSDHIAAHATGIINMQ